MTPDEIIAAFKALPLHVRARVYADGLEECNKRVGPIECDPIFRPWTSLRLRNVADGWEAEDKAAAERSALIEDLARETFYGACGERALPGSWDRQPQVLQDMYRRAATHLLDSPRFEVRRDGDQ